MTDTRPPAWGDPPGRAVIRSCPEDFMVTEQLGFEPSGEGEHVFLYVQKRNLNSADLQQRIADLAGVPSPPSLAPIQPDGDQRAGRGQVHRKQVDGKKEDNGELLHR